MKEELGARIREAREAAGLTQSQLAARVGTRSGRGGTVSDWEAGRGDLSAEVLAEIRRETDCDGHWLLTGEGTMEKRSPTDAEKRLAKLKAAMREPL